jgi:hypothetical protein
LRANPRHPTFRQVFRDNRQALAEARLGLRQHAAAEELAQFAYNPANDLYSAACFLGRCVPLANKGSEGVEDPRPTGAPPYADRAMALLRQAVGRGYPGAEKMKQDKNLDALRPRRDFQKLLAEMQLKKTDAPKK